MTIAELSLQIALSQEGVSENPKGSNGGPEVNQYLRSVGLGAGYAWCMAFVYWSVNQACQQLGKTNPLLKTAGVILQWNDYKRRDKITGWKIVKPGTIFIMSFEHGLGHTGFVERYERGTLYTIEGNTNNDGSREGYMVARRERRPSSMTGFIHLP